MTIQQLEKLNLPDTPGVYRFLGPEEGSKKEREILYVGKATSLKDRVKSYFSRDLIFTRGEGLVEMISRAETLEVTSTHSVLEALILEAVEIKKYMPRFNTAEKDDKSFNHVIITNEDFPQVLLVRGKQLPDLDKRSIKYSFGPFPHGGQLKEAMKIIRRIFPYRDEKCTPAEYLIKADRRDKIRACFNYHIGLCPGVCIGAISKEDYAKQINHIRLFFEGKKQELINNLERDMKNFAAEQKFEEANDVKKTIFALDHIQDIALLKRERFKTERIEQEIKSADLRYVPLDQNENEIQTNEFRIEAYDVAHISGTSHVGVMVVLHDGEPAKSDYRKFKIKTERGANDVGALTEILKRRFRHAEWRKPDLIVVDGAEAQLNAAQKVLAEKGLEIPLVSVVKDRAHKPKDVLAVQTKGSENMGAAENQKFSAPTSKYRPSILLANAEAHRFAIGYHRQMRGRLFRS